MVKKTSRHSRGFTIPLAPVAGIVACPAIRWMATHAMAGDLPGVLTEAGRLVGMEPDGKFSGYTLINNMTPIFVGLIVHVLASKLGLNRLLGRAGVPFIRI